MIWTEKLRNEEVLNRFGENRLIMKTLRERKLGYIFCNHPKNDGLQNIVIEGVIEKRRSRDRRRTIMMSTL